MTTRASWKHAIFGWPLMLCVSGLVFLMGACRRQSAGSEASSPSRPNVLLIVLDTNRADFYSCYGHPRPTTPRIDQFAGQGVRFTRAYSTDFWTLPAHASLFTGLYPTELQATSETLRLPEEAVTLAELLRARGYKTGGLVVNTWLAIDRGFAQGFEYYEELWKKKNLPPSVEDPVQIEPVAVERAIRWMSARIDESSPFFMFVNLMVAHLPYRPLPEYRARFLSRPWPEERLDMLMTIRGMWPYYAGAIKLDEDDFLALQDLYQAELSMADDYFGQLLDALISRSQLDNTLVILTSDHGENIGDHGMIDHMISMYEATTRVPLIIRYPARFTPGTVNENLVSLVDVFPTILDVCDLLDDSAPAYPERSLAHEPGHRRRFVAAENDRPKGAVAFLKRKYPHVDASAVDHRMRMIRTESHKLIWWSDGRVELFDVAADPGEIRNVAEDEPVVLSELQRYLEEWTRHVEANKITENPPTFTPTDRETIESLKALGYVHDEE